VPYELPCPRGFSWVLTPLLGCPSRVRKNEQMCGWHAATGSLQRSIGGLFALAVKVSELWSGDQTHRGCGTPRVRLRMRTKL
jgi:hypothetical protein